MSKCYLQAAEYGKTLLEQNMELEAAKEAAMQEKHELVLKLQAKVGVMMFLMIKITKMGIMMSLMMKITRTFCSQCKPRWGWRPPSWGSSRP